MLKNYKSLSVAQRFHKSLVLFQVIVIPSLISWHLHIIKKLGKVSILLNKMRHCPGWKQEIKFYIPTIAFSLNHQGLLLLVLSATWSPCYVIAYHLASHNNLMGSRNSIKTKLYLKPVCHCTKKKCKIKYFIHTAIISTHKLMSSIPIRASYSWQVAHFHCSTFQISLTVNEVSQPQMDLEGLLNPLPQYKARLQKYHLSNLQ